MSLSCLAATTCLFFVTTVTSGAFPAAPVGLFRGSHQVTVAGGGSLNILALRGFGGGESGVKHDGQLIKDEPIAEALSTCMLLLLAPTGCYGRRVPVELLSWLGVTDARCPLSCSGEMRGNE